jgi:CheY-like chemotaxis protein
VDRHKAEREREQLLESERAARGEAERASRLKDQFLATVSHELRTPLSAILGWVDILQRNMEDKASLGRGIQVIERNARIQAQLVSDLLDVSRIVSGKLSLELQLVQLQSVIEQAVDTVRTAAEAKKLQLEQSVEAEIPPIAGDPDRLQQVVWNLLSNAVKFTPEGGVVGIRLQRSRDRAVIAVYDTGAGITSEFIPHLFDRFRQADSSPSRRHGGLGLGLTIVKQLVELHGGTVSAQSSGSGRGSTFTVELPLDAADRPDAAQEPSGQTVAHGGVTAARLELLRGLRVLIVEDDNDGRELLERLLCDAGCVVTAAPSAGEALQALRAQPQELLVSDIGLPDQDGYSLLMEIRQSSDLGMARIPAIALTAFARSEDRARALHAGFQAHLSKPVNVAELLATVTSFAGISRGR